MTTLDYIEVDNDKLDVVITVEFASGQDDSTLLEALYRLVKVLRRGRLGNRFEELISLDTTLASCKIRLRYFTKELQDHLGRGPSGYEDMLGIWFEKYLVATIDQVRKIESHPFHVPNLSVFLELSDPFDSDPSPNL